VSTEILQPIYDALGQGRFADARELCHRVPDQHRQPAVQHALALTCCGEGAFGEAALHLEHACRIDGATARWVRDLGIVYGKLGRWADVVEMLRPQLDALDSDGLALFLTAAVEIRRPDGALADLEAHRSGPLPSDPQFLFAHGVALGMAERHAEAEAALMRCLAHDHERGDVHEALAFIYDAGKEAERGLHHARECLRLQPDSTHARLRLALACSERGLCNEGRALRLEAVRGGLTRPDDRSVNLYVMLSDPHEDGASIAVASRQAFADVPAIPAEPTRSTSTRRGAGRLRVGYVSGECRSTPAYYFFRPFLSRHTRESIEVYIYSSNPRRDAVTPRYREWAQHWRDCGGLSDAALVDRIRADELDVVVDLSGHFIYNRLTALVSRVAPVQVTFPNFPGTTGCPGIDYFFSDAWTSPTGTEADYVEQLYRLPSGYLMYAPPDDGPAVGRLPMDARDGATFGVFQRLAKFNDGVWDALAAVLHRVPASSLFIQAGDRELDRPDSQTCAALRRHLALRDVNPARVTFKGPLPYLEHLSVMTQVDVALDTFPYGGQTTTCEALWMGVPVVTLSGRTHVSRVSGALLARAGHADWVATSLDDYGTIAADLVADAGRLANIRHQLRGDVLDRLADGGALTRDLEEAYWSFRR
jgi:predicted O-linked N-acetylglucosamine transferase (SPINDLY family)